MCRFGGGIEGAQLTLLRQDAKEMIFFTDFNSL